MIPWSAKLRLDVSLKLWWYRGYQRTERWSLIHISGLHPLCMILDWWDSYVERQNVAVH